MPVVDRFKYEKTTPIYAFYRGLSQSAAEAIRGTIRLRLRRTVPWMSCRSSVTGHRKLNGREATAKWSYTSERDRL